MPSARVVSRLAITLAALGAAPAVTAMPNFARHEGLDCSACHTTIPRLSRIGFDFRNAGFRIPDNLGKVHSKDLDWSDLNTARLQSQAQWTRTTTAGVTAPPKGSITFFEATLYPLTGSFGRWWSTEGELSMAPEDVFEVENAYLRFTYGSADSHLNVRAGVFHPFEGYGASDRPVSLARPLIQTATARERGGTTSYFTTWGIDQAGVEVGYTYHDTNVQFTLFNGTFVENGAVFPFQGGNLVRPASDPNYNAKDIQVFANQFIGAFGAAVSAYYYHGTVTLPFGAAQEFTDTFDRVALYGTLPVVPQFWVLAGYQAGWDKSFNQTTGTAGDKFMSTGWFGELYAPVIPMAGASVRFDHFDPSRGVSDDRIWAVTASVNVAAFNGAQGILEYQHRDAETGATTSTTQDQVRFRMIYIW